MEFVDSLRKRRSYYEISKDVDLPAKEIIKTIEDIALVVPDAINMQSARLVVALGEYQDKLWDMIYDAFEGKVKREKIDSFKSGFGTVMFFYDNETVERMKEKYSLYADNFPFWALQANGMLQISIWTALRDLGLGASLQHYNPVIDEAIKELFMVPKDWILLAQMPFGKILSEPAPKEKLDIKERVRVWD